MEQLPNIDVARVRQYNAELKVYSEKSANTRAKMEMSKAEVKRLCAELTEELGVQVTPENLEAIYKQCVEKIENTLTSGEAILNRIKQEESSISIGQTSQSTEPMAGFTQVAQVGIQSSLDSLGGAHEPRFEGLPNMFGHQVNL